MSWLIQKEQNVDDEFQQQIIHNYVDIMAETVVDGEMGAGSISDEITGTDYLVKWRGNPYTLQETLVNILFSDTEIIEEGEMVLMLCTTILYHTRT